MKYLLPLLALLILTGCPSESARVEAPQQSADGPGGAANRPAPKNDDSQVKAERDAKLAKEAQEKAAQEEARADEAKREQAADKEKAEKQAAEAAAEELRDGDLRVLAGRVLLSFGRWSSQVEEPNFVKVTLGGGTLKHTFERPITFGIGSVRSGMRSVFRDALPASWDKYEQNGWQGRLRLVTNDLLRERIGGDLFGKQPGRVNAAPLRKLLDTLYIDPDQPLLGVAASKVYAVVREPVRDYTKGYAVMKPNKAAATKSFVEARKKFGADSDKYSNDMMEWYYAQADVHGIKEKLKMGERRGDYLISGFWLRRFSDGTDKICYDFLRKVTKAYDPSWKP